MSAAECFVRDGYTDVPPGKLANVVTCLEMREPPSSPELHSLETNAFTLERVPRPNLAWYRELFTRVGSEYLWTSRLLLDDETLAAILHDPLVEVYVLRRDGGDAGIVELDFRVNAQCEITLFGVVPEALGSGAGRWMMQRTLEIAWSRDIARLWLHTCTFDHPRALAFYLRNRFTPFKRQIEIHPDPRVLGLLPRSCAPHVPIL